jgi:epoxyqueuosine reductase
MQSFKRQIKEYASKNGVDLIGFASKERFDGLDARRNPFSIFPEGKTVILVGRRITRGTLRGTEEGSNFGDYWAFGYTWLDDEFVAQSCYDVVRFIEDQGYEAVPIFPNPPECNDMGVSVAEGRPAPNVTPDFQYAAVACGLGEIGLHGEFLSKKFGPRQRFQMIITDAEMEPDPIMQESICTLCGKCADTCPLHAIDKTKLHEVSICGKVMKVAEIDESLCQLCKNGAVQNRLFKGAKSDKLGAICVRTCICQLEESKSIENRFEKPFRQREAWGLDALGKNVKVNG